MSEGDEASKPQTPEEVREKAEVLHTGRWYIAELEEPPLAVQGESEFDALQKLVKRWKEYTDDGDDVDIRLHTVKDDADGTRLPSIPEAVTPDDYPERDN